MKYTFSLLFFLITGNVFSQSKCVLSGTIADMRSGSLYVNKLSGITLDRQEIKFNENKFSFELAVSESEVYTIYFKDDVDDDGGWTPVRFVASPGKHVYFNLQRQNVSSSTVSGDADTRELEKFDSINVQFWRSAKTGIKAIMNSEIDSVTKAAKLAQQQKKNNELYISHIFSYAQQNNTIIAPFSVYQVIKNNEDIDPELKPELSIDTLQLLYKRFLTFMPDSKFVKGLGKYIEGVKEIKTGNHFIDFSLVDKNEKMIRFSEIAQGKLILLDFWASWCGPCRKKYKEIKPIYNEFKNKNFEIFSVSIDTDKKRWLDAVKVDKIEWKNVIDLNSATQIADVYQAYSIPTNYLINAEGTIIAKNISAEELRIFLNKSPR